MKSYNYNNLKKGITLIVLSLLVWSCNLEIEETDSVFADESSGVFIGVENIEGSLTNIYDNISGEAGDQANLYALTEVTTDELLVPTRGTDWGDNGVWRTLHTHTWDATHAHLLTVWNQKNSAVLRATEVIETEGVGAEQAASAKFARAYNMWIVMDFFGQVPFRNPTDGIEVIPSVMTREDAYGFVLKDLTEAIEGLPAGNPSATDKTAPNKATARLFLAKLKLNAHIYKGKGTSETADLDDVIKQVDSIESDGYGLTGIGSYFNVFVGGGDNANVDNNDLIWHVTKGANSGNRMWNGLHYNQGHTGNGGGGWNGFTTLSEFYDLFEGPSDTNVKGGTQEERRGFAQTMASTNADNQGFGFGFQLGQMYGWKDGSAVALKDRSESPLAFTRELPGLTGNNEKTGIRVLKYSPANGAFTPGVVMARFADAHLMRAEAMLRKGDDAGSLTEVNELRGMRENTPNLTALNEQELLDERARELYTEGWRRNDLIRFGKFTKNWQFKDEGSVDDANKNLFPIPASALLSNPGLTQNPGY